MLTLAQGHKDVLHSKGECLVLFNHDDLGHGHVHRILRAYTNFAYCCARGNQYPDADKHPFANIVVYSYNGTTIAADAGNIPTTCDKAIPYANANTHVTTGNCYLT